jgi:ankyrin repeat protein
MLDNDILGIVSNIDKQYNGKTRLIIAVENNQNLIVRKLIERGANIEAIDFSGKTPLIIAVENNNLAIVRELLERGANKEVSDLSGKTPLIIAVENNMYTIFRELIDKGANKEALDNRKPPLIISIENNNLSIVRKLLEKGANIEAKYNGKIPFIIAIENNRYSIIKEFLNYDVDPNVIDINSGDSALYIAVKSRMTTIVELLLNRGANLLFRNIDISKNGGKTIFKYIIDNHLTEIMNLRKFDNVKSKLYLIKIAREKNLPIELEEIIKNLL